MLSSQLQDITNHDINSTSRNVTTVLLINPHASNDKRILHQWALSVGHAVLTFQKWTSINIY